MELPAQAGISSGVYSVRLLRIEGHIAVYKLSGCCVQAVESLRISDPAAALMWSNRYVALSIG